MLPPAHCDLYTPVLSPNLSCKKKQEGWLSPTLLNVRHQLSSYVPGTIAVNVTRFERGFNACKTPRCIYPSVFNRFPVIQASTPHLCLAAPQWVTPSEFCDDLDTHKTKMNGLSCGEESITICSAVLIQYQRVTDGQTSSLYLLRASA